MDVARLVDLQSSLRPFEQAGGTIPAEPRTFVVLPSLNLDRSILEFHAPAVPAYEERFLYLLFVLRRPQARLVVCTSLPIPDAIVDHYLSLMPDAPDARERLHLVTPDDASLRPLAPKLLDRPDLLAEIRRLVGPNPRDSFLLPFNVTDAEVELAMALDIPLYGIDARFEHYGTKSGARQLFAEEGVPHPRGYEDLRSRAALRRAIAALRAENPQLRAVVAKHDDGVAGEGNAVIPLATLPDPGSAGEQAAIDVKLRTLPDEWIAGLRARGGIVEEMVTAEEVLSPSVQLRILPGQGARVISTHDQVLGGTLGQTYVGCRFPAHPDYGPLIVAEARDVGDRLAREGAIGRFGIDFVVLRDGAGDWRAYAIEINLREGGTTHPYGTLWLLTDGRMAEDFRSYRLPDGSTRAYFGSDQVEDPAYRGLTLPAVLDAVRGAGLIYDPATRKGIVLHMLRCIEVEGRLAAVAIGEDADEAHEIYVRLIELLDGLCVLPEVPLPLTGWPPASP